MDSKWDIIKSRLFSLISDLDSGVEVLLVQRDTELIKFLIHLFGKLLLFFPLLLFLFSNLLLLSEPHGLSLLSFFISDFSFLGFLLLDFLSLFLFFFSFLLSNFLISLSFFFSYFSLCSLFLSFSDSLFLSLHIGLSLFYCHLLL